jgi:hypothetical protein
MLNVGFFGGHTVHGLGPACDMQAFFTCVKMAASSLDSKVVNFSLIDRLYRRYVKLDELQATAALIAQIQVIMRDIQTHNIEWNTIVPLHGATRLDTSKISISDVFEKYFFAFDDSVGSAQSFYKTFGKYRPVLTIISDMPRFLVDEKRPPMEYDALEGEPMWLR